jgi:hypothetical protein
MLDAPMAGRRKDQRYRLPTPWEGRLRVLRDVRVASVCPGRLLILSRFPLAPGAELSLDLLAPGGRAATRVRVLGSRPVIEEGQILHQLSVELLQASVMTSVSPSTAPSKT